MSSEPSPKRRKVEGPKKQWFINTSEVSKEVLDYIVANAGLVSGLTGGATRTSAHFSGTELIHHDTFCNYTIDEMAMFIRHIGACLKEGSFYGVERGYAFLETCPPFAPFKLLAIYDALQFNEFRVTKEPTTKDSLLHFVSNTLPKNAWMIPFIENFKELSPLELAALHHSRGEPNPNVFMDIPREFRDPPPYARNSFQKKDWIQLKIRIFEYEVIDTFVGTYVRLGGPFYLCKPANELHRMAQCDLESSGELPITVNVPNDGSFNPSNKTMIQYSNGDKYWGSTVLTCLGFLKHGMGDFSQGNVIRTVSNIFGFEMKTEVEADCKCSTPAVDMNKASYNTLYYTTHPKHYRGYPEFFYKSCATHATIDKEFWERKMYTFAMNLHEGMKTSRMSPFHELTLDEMNALRSEGLLPLFSDRFSVVKCDTEALYHEFIQPTEAVKREKDEKFFLNLRELGVRLDLLRLTKDDKEEEGVKAVMDEE